MISWDIFFLHYYCDSTFSFHHLKYIWCKIQHFKSKAILIEFGVPIHMISHSRIWHYFISYLLTCDVDIFEVLEIMAQMWQYIFFFSHKPTSDWKIVYLLSIPEYFSGNTKRQCSLCHGLRKRKIFRPRGPIQFSCTWSWRATIKKCTNT